MKRLFEISMLDIFVCPGIRNPTGGGHGPGLKNVITALGLCYDISYLLGIYGITVF